MFRKARGHLEGVPRVVLGSLSTCKQGELKNRLAAFLFLSCEIPEDGFLCAPKVSPVCVQPLP